MLAAHSDSDNQCVPDGDLLERHPFFAHEKEDREIDETVGDELGGAAGQCASMREGREINIANVCRNPVLPADAWSEMRSRPPRRGSGTRKRMPITAKARAEPSQTNA